MQSPQAPSTATAADATLLPPKELARAVGAAMFAADTASREFMHMELLTCEPGHASMRMEVRPELLNGLSICHGGFIFTLADSTFAFACNSYNTMTVAAGCNIDFLKPARLGDVLTCTGEEQSLQGRHGVYDMRVTNQRGETVALFRGKSTQISGKVLPDAAGQN
jgi:acyl-CoA thioesterase